MRIKRILACAIIISATLWPDAALAQPPDVEQATKESDRPLREEALEKVTPPAKKPPRIEEKKEPEKIEGPSFVVKKIEVRGVESISPEILRPIIEKYENKDATLAELKILAGEIEREYLRHGIIAACFVPPQEVKEGVVILQVVEARMGELKINSHPFFSEKRIAYYWGIKRGDIVRYDKIARSLDLINKNPDRYSKATLHSGKKPGTTDCIIDTESKFPVHVIGSLDREGAIPTGRYRKGLGLVNNNLLGLDDSLILGYIGGKFFGSVYAYHKIPITNFGTTVLYGYSQSRSFPKKDYEAFDMSSRTNSASLYLYQDLYQKAERAGEIKVGIEANDKESSWTQGTLNHDKLRIIRVGGTLLKRDATSIVWIKPEYSQGLNFLGARRRSAFSSRGASNTFSKGRLGVNFTKIAAKGVRFNGKVDAQIAGQGLAPQEEFYLGGINSIRGYPYGDFVADNGYYTSLELLIPAFILPEKLKLPYGERPLRDEITGVLFCDFGYGEKRNASPTEISKRKLASLGAGVRLRLLNQALLRLEWAWPVDAVANMPDTEFSRSRFHFSIDFQDEVPRETERLLKAIDQSNAETKAWAIVNSQMRTPEGILAKKIHGYMRAADETYKKGDLELAKKYYSTAYRIGTKAFRQAFTYIREAENHKNELDEYARMAEQYYKNGDYEKAAEMWQRIKDEANIMPLVLEL